MQRNTEGAKGDGLSRRSLVKGAGVAIPALAVPSLGALTWPAAAANDSLVFSPGQSRIELTTSGLWNLVLANASVTSKGSDLAPGQLKMQLDWDPQAGTNSTLNLQARQVDMPLWAAPPSGTKSPTLDYTYQNQVKGNVPVVIPDGSYCFPDSTGSQTKGNLNIRFTANGPSTAWTLKVPTTQVAFNPRRSYAGYCRLYYLGPAYPTVRWGWEPDTTALVRYQGAQGSLVPGATFYLKAKLQPQPGYSLPSGTRIEDINSFRFRGWAVSRVSSTELIYYYGSPARNATTLELIPPPLTPDIYPNPSVGYLFYSTKQLPDPWRFRIEVGITVPTGLQSLPKVPPVVYYFQR